MKHNVIALVSGVSLTALFSACSEAPQAPTVGAPALGETGSCPVVVVNWRIPDNPRCTSPTIQGGVDKVKHGGIVRVLSGTYVEAVEIKNKSLTLKTVGKEPVILAPANQASGVIYVRAHGTTVQEPPPARIEVTIRGPLVIEPQTAGIGYGIRGLGLVDLTVDEVTVRDPLARGVISSNEVPGARGKLVLRNSDIAGAPEPSMVAVHVLRAVDAVIENNVIRRSDWSCIQVQEDANAVIIGNDLDECGVQGGIRVYNSPSTTEVDVVGNTIRNSSSSSDKRYGIFYVAKSGRIERNTIIDYVQPAVEYPRAAAVYVVTEAAVARFNDIAGNAHAGLRAWPDIDATCNWWGSPDGPSGDGPGSGDAVHGDAIVIPFATAPIAESEETTCSGAP